MPRDEQATPAGDRSQRLWAVRVFVVGAFALTIWLCGPRALDVLAARYQQATAQSPLVELDQVGFVHEPDWLHGPLLLAVMADIGPALQDSIAILDEPASLRLKAGLEASPWIRRVDLTRQFPDRFRLAVELRRPVVAVEAEDGELLGLVGADGRALAPVAGTDLPVVRLYREGGFTRIRMEPGAPVAEPRVLVAVGIALEWRDELAPLVPAAPRLLEIDTTNLGERWMRGRSYPEVRIKLARADGQPVIFGYGRPVDAELPRVSVATKATVLANILAKHPALVGLVAGDLRFVNRWADYLQPRGPGVPDPDGPWSNLERLSQPDDDGLPVSGR